jgi:AmiR/NasT family two-component response regulator
LDPDNAPSSYVAPDKTAEGRLPDKVARAVENESEPFQPEVHQAAGVLMHQFSLEAADAYALLQSYADTRGESVLAVAVRIVELRSHAARRDKRT